MEQNVHAASSSGDTKNLRAAAPSIINNTSTILKDELIREIRPGDDIDIAADSFSIYGFQELAKQLKDVHQFRFLYIKPTFLKQKSDKKLREFYIPRLGREQSVYGTDFEIRLRNELTQRSIGKRCADWICHHAVAFRSIVNENNLISQQPVLSIFHPKEHTHISYTPFGGLTARGLGTQPTHDFQPLIFRHTGAESKALSSLFEQVWSDTSATQDVTRRIIDSVSTTFRENAPQTVYYMALNTIFHEFLNDVSEDNLPDSATGYRNSEVWRHLYDFQRDAAFALINKLETYNGCILADSVGLGKTFTALAVIKYYESRNRNVLVLCPKKLGDNWLTYRGNVRDNPFADDHFRYDVLYHTDLLRTHGKGPTGLDLARMNWGNYDLVVIDESHNFRNGEQNAKKAKNRVNRYTILRDRIIKPGVQTKVLMLSATPVNNRFDDLRNQLALAYAGHEDEWASKLKLSTSIDSVFRQAQVAYTNWAKLPPEDQTSQRLTEMLSMDFYTILDQVTVARSRRHIEEHYDMSRIGAFPHREKPISRTTRLTDLSGVPDYHAIYAQLDKLKMVAYTPSQYLLPSKVTKYGTNNNLTILGQEEGIRKLMQTNLLKRLESSVDSFRKTLIRVQEFVSSCLQKIERYQEHMSHSKLYGRTPSTFAATEYGLDNYDLDFEDSEETTFYIGKNDQRINLHDLDLLSWQEDLEKDQIVLNTLITALEPVTPEHDLKLADLKKLLRKKVNCPLNAGNRKIIVFTAFADTAEYLYSQLQPVAHSLGMHSAIITGKSVPHTDLDRHLTDMNQILTLFSPQSKERNVVYPDDHRNIDLLIATDCISEGQNLQDCDFLVNYDIHWNPVRIIQRFGRIDRIGSPNKSIQLVNYWPNVSLDEYLNLRERVESRMKATILTSTDTNEDNPLSTEKTQERNYRERQLIQIHSKVADLEEVQGGISITDLGLNEFRMDLIEYSRKNPGIEQLPHGLEAVVHGNDTPSGIPREAGTIFVLRNVNSTVKGRNPLYPFYLVYVREDGSIAIGHLEPRRVLDALRDLCDGKTNPDTELAHAFNVETQNGRNMKKQSTLLGDAIASIINKQQESDVDSLFSDGTSTIGKESITGLDDFELICFLVVR